MTETTNCNTRFITEYIKKFLALDTVLDSIWFDFETSKIHNPNADSWIIPKEYKDTVDELNFLVETYVNYIKRGLTINDALNIVKTNYEMWQCASQNVRPDTVVEGDQIGHTAKDMPGHPHRDIDVNVEQIYHNPHMTGQYLTRNIGC